MNERIVSLLYRHSKGELLNEEERKELDEWVAKSKHNGALYNELSNQEELQRDVKKMLSYDTEAIWDKYERLLHPEKKTATVHLFNRRFLRYAAVGATLIILSLTTYFLVTRKSESHQPLTTDQSPAIHDIPPGTDGAVLTLSDGRQIDLNSAAKGEIAKEGDIRVVKSADGQITYQSSGSGNSSGKIIYNTVSTQQKQKFNVVLPDGTEVTLNAASSITYPSAFIGNERPVSFTGELFFDVARDATKPFKAKNDGMAIEVLGTHFNVNAYDDEGSINTTLVEGSVKISKDGNNSFLKPGQQAVVTKTGKSEIKVVKDVDIDQVVAWKEGVFSFKKSDIGTIMRQVSRWYGVEIVYKDNIEEHFVATLPRSVPVSKLLQILEKMGGVHFDIDDVNKKIIVRR